MRVVAAAVAAAMLSVGAAQAGDVANGERVFNRSCRSCHAIVDPSGKVIVAGQKTGPNQWALIGSRAGHDPEFTRYGASLKAAGEKGLVWTEEAVVEYLADPRGFLRTFLDDSSARSLMMLRLQDPIERADVAAYLATMR